MNSDLVIQEFAESLDIMRTCPKSGERHCTVVVYTVEEAMKVRNAMERFIKSHL